VSRPREIFLQPQRAVAVFNDATVPVPRIKARSVTVHCTLHCVCIVTAHTTAAVDYRRVLPTYGNAPSSGAPRALRYLQVLYYIYPVYVW
jgi:hypothetical protein